MKWLSLSIICLATISLANAVCQDMSTNCRSTKSLCAKDGMIRLYCQKTCGVCKGTDPTRAPIPPHTTGCGQPDIQGVRIIGGATPVRGSWPWQILITLRGEPICGGTLISPEWVVTAGHCVYKLEKAIGFKVRVGEYNTKVEEGSEEDIPVKKIILHADYEPYELINDIALMKLSRPVTFNKFVSPICLPSAEVPVGTNCYVTGWGKIKHPGSMTNLLQQALLPVVSNDECTEKNKGRVRIPITENVVCGGSGGERSSCHGDSGGPYVCEINGKWELHGAVSYGALDCSPKDAYTVFTRIYNYKTWLLEQMQSN